MDMQQSGETWSELVTRLRLDYLARRKWERPNVERDCSSWPTPTTSEGNGARAADGRRGVGLNTEAQQWPTPAARDGKGSTTDPVGPDGRNRLDQLDRAAEHWQTPKEARGSYTRDHGEKGAERSTLIGQAVNWPTPTAEQYGSSQNGINGKGGENERPSAGTPSLDRQARDVSLYSHPDGTNTSVGHRCSQECRRLNPLFVEWLMGWPIGWTDCASQETAFIQWRQQWRSYLYGQN